MTVNSQFNSLTSENVLKFNWVEPQPDQYNFSDGDYLMTYSVDHHQRLHGHTLIWHQALPDWVNQFQGDSTAWEELFRNHIQTVVKHYKGKIGSWDVVNEAFRDDNGEVRVVDSVTPGNGSIWGQHLGKDYIARAFQYANKADSSALLFYNDYGQEFSPAKVKAIISLVGDFKKRSIQIDGLGIQCHINIYTDTAKMTDAVMQLVSTGLRIHFSELDISVNPNNDPNAIYTNDLQIKQGAMFEYIGHLYNRIPEKQRFGITTWNVGDSDSWITSWLHRKDWPLLFDLNYHYKAATYGFLKGLRE